MSSATNYLPTFVPGDRQLADVLTKALPPALHRVALRQLLSAPDERPAADCVGWSVRPFPCRVSQCEREGVLEDGRDVPSDGRSDARSDGRNAHSQ